MTSGTPPDSGLASRLCENLRSTPLEQPVKSSATVSLITSETHALGSCAHSPTQPADAPLPHEYGLMVRGRMSAGGHSVYGVPDPRRTRQGSNGILKA